MSGTGCYPTTGNSRWQSLLLVAALGLLTAACSTKPEPQKVAPVARTVDKVTVVVSNRAPVFEGVANHLSQAMGEKATIYYLTGKSTEDSQLLDKVVTADKQQVVAIGLPAALWSKQLEHRQIVFCQVFNYQQYDLVNARRKGVSSIPPPAQLFARWKALSPGLRRVVTITGPFHEALIGEARAAARKEGLRLDHIVVRSDKEYVYAYKKNASRYQGIWLLPDNRVLSRKAIREVMSYSVRQGKQAMVFTPQLLGIGGLISAEPRSDDVANQVLRRLRDARDSNEIPGSDVIGLTRTRFEINNLVARQLGLKPIAVPRGGGA